MPVRGRPVLLVLGAFVLAALGWVVAGWVARMVGLDELDPPIRAGGVFLALSLGEAALTRFAGNG